MTDFFGALELELRAASQRRPRRPVGIGQVIGVAAAATLVAVALAVAVTVSGGGEGGSGQTTGARKPDPVGTVIPRSKSPYESRALVVANGVAPVTGPWQIEVSRTKGERDTNGAVMWRKGYCSWLHVLDPTDPALRGGAGYRSGHCGSPRSLGFRKTPGFSRAQGMATSKPRPKEVLVWGRVPDRAAMVVITAPDGLRIEVEPSEGPKTFPGRFYGIPVEPGHPGARINWFDKDGEPGSRGIRLMPPITR
jgi:hypothetical protein